MADYTQTITNSLSVLAASPATLWNAFNWNEETWGQDEDLWTDTNKGVSNTLVLNENWGRDFVKAPITETITLSEDLSDLTRSIGVWDYIFTKPTLDGRNSVYDEFSKVADGDTSWSSVSEASSTWSDA